MNSSRYIPTNPTLQVIINSDYKEFNSTHTASVQSSWTSLNGSERCRYSEAPKSVLYAKEKGGVGGIIGKGTDLTIRMFRDRVMGLRITSTTLTYIKKVKDIGGRWR
ncbi:hypothetical protein D9613_008518 [Agrocybe pediades]|uniref:Uncharacterized protein n=1 Tax=Agrocybe pediades TaxID=84607 RepID=A0A8H4QTK3_9AGAR|nr:hypothetical protein D9613_008518 [Agrocybe pediades]